MAKAQKTESCIQGAPKKPTKERMHNQQNLNDQKGLDGSPQGSSGIAIY